MTNDIIRFGDIYVRQISGTTIGKPPAPAWATILHEIEFLPYFESNLLFYNRFIDDIFGIWKPSQTQIEDNANWHRSQQQSWSLVGSYREITTTTIPRHGCKD